MREIKFRAKRLDNGEWVEGGVVHQTDYYGDKVDKYFIIDGTCTVDYDIGEVFEVEKNTICQYTGLKDKNGKEIYEGDVVKKVDTNGLGWHRERNCKVSFDKEGYWLLTTEYGDGYWIGEVDIEQLEVIGNIFNNLELLKNSDKLASKYADNEVLKPAT